MKFLISNLRLLLRRFKSVAIINVVGLGVAFAVLLVVAMQVRYDLSYDRGFENSREIFISENAWGEWEFDVNMNWPLPELWSQRIPEIKNYALRRDMARTTALQREGEGSDAPHFDLIVEGASPSFPEVFSMVFTAGGAGGTFDAPGRCVIPQSAAAAIFGTDDPVGRMLVQADTPSLTYTIDGVYRDFPANSSIPNSLYTHAEVRNQGNYFYNAYFVIDPRDRDAVVAKMNDSTLLGNLDPERFYAGERYALTNLGDYYLHGGAEGGGHFGFTLYLLVIGGLILAVAIINFINLSMAMAPSRVRGVNIHRILGIGKRALRASLSMEAVVMAAVAVVAGCFAVTADLTLAHNIPLVALCALGLLAVAFGVGAYTSRYATSFDVAIALKSSFALSRHGAGLRNTLVVVQFATAVFFICVSAFVWIQYNYMSTYSTGYQRENIVYVPAMADSLSNASFAQELAKNPAITGYTVSDVPGYTNNIVGSEIDGREVTAHIWPGDDNLLDFFGVEMVAGENFSAAQGERKAIVNREFMRKYGFTDDEVMGKELNGAIIVGVAEDVNFQSLHEPIKPMAFFSARFWRGSEAFIKIAGTDVAATTRFIEQTWHKFATEVGTDYSLTFLDEKIDALYHRELNTSQLIGVLGMMAVAIAVMGVFGLIMFNTRYKTREIAIRKVNGATRTGVALMLNRNMLILVGVGFALAVPLTLVFITRWVEGFAYKAAVPWWLFPTGGFVVLAIAVATVSYQSWRAASANPVNALKTE